MAIIARLAASLGIDTRDFEYGIKRADVVVRDFSNKIKRLTGAALGFYGFYDFVKQTMQWSSQLVDLNKRTGVSIEKLQELDYIAKKAGLSLMDLVSFFEKVKRSQAEAVRGNANMIKAFADLGVSLDDLKKKSGYEISMGIIRNIRGLGEELSPQLFQVGGRGAGAILQLANENIDELITRFQRLGVIIEDETIRKFDELNKSLEDLVKIGRGPFVELLKTLVDWTNQILVGFKQLSQFLGALNLFGKNPGEKSPLKSIGNVISESYFAFMKGTVDAFKGQGKFSDIFKQWGNIFRREVLEPIENRYTRAMDTVLQLTREEEKINKRMQEAKARNDEAEMRRQQQMLDMLREKRFIEENMTAWEKEIEEKRDYQEKIDKLETDLLTKSERRAKLEKQLLQYRMEYELLPEDQVKLKQETRLKILETERELRGLTKDQRTSTDSLARIGGFVTSRNINYVQKQVNLLQKIHDMFRNGHAKIVIKD